MLSVAVPCAWPCPTRHPDAPAAIVRAWKTCIGMRTRGGVTLRTAHLLLPGPPPAVQHPSTPCPAATAAGSASVHHAPECAFSIIAPLPVPHAAPGDVAPQPHPYTRADRVGGAGGVALVHAAQLCRAAIPSIGRTELVTRYVPTNTSDPQPHLSVPKELMELVVGAVA